jgi:hypothetical protein
MNNMDRVMDTVEQAAGLSRRDMIKASVVAGALVWSAPVLLSGTASAQTGCCPSPFQEVALKFTSDNPNCGVTCLDQLVDDNVDCCQALADALITSVTFDAGVQNGPQKHPGTATITINTALATLTGASVRGGATGQPLCFNRVRTPANSCNFAPDPTGGRVTFDNDANPTVVNILMHNGSSAETINQAEVLLCVKTSISLFC